MARGWNSFGSGDRGGGAKGGSAGAWKSDGLEFDTKGVKEFAAEIGKAEKVLKSFVGQVRDLDRLLKGMDDKKIAALAAIGNAKGITGGNGGDVSFSSAKSPAHPEGAPATSGDAVRGADGRGDGESHNTSRFGGLAGGGVAGAYFAGELIQRASSRISAGAIQTRQTHGAMDYANVVGQMRGGGSYMTYGKAASWNDLYGVTGTDDATALQTGIRMRWGTGVNGAAPKKFAQQMGALNSINPAFGGAANAFQDYTSAFTSPEAQWGMIQQGIRPAIEGGQLRNPNQVFSDLIQRATGKNIKDLTRKEAQAAFGYGGQGRVNIERVLAPGMSGEMLDSIGLLATEGAGRGITAGMNNEKVRDSIIGKEFSRSEQDTQAAAVQTRKGRDSTMNVIEAENRLAGALDHAKNAFAGLTPYITALADKLGGGLAAGATAGSLLPSGLMGTASTALAGIGLKSVLGGRGAAAAASGAAGGVGRLATVAGAAGRWGNAFGAASTLGKIAKVANPVARVATVGSALVNAGKDDTFFGVEGTNGSDWSNLTNPGTLWEAGKNIFGIGDPVAGVGPGHFTYADIGDPGDASKIPGDLDPGFGSRIKSLVEAAPFDISVSSGRRSTKRQEEIFLSRHRVVAAGTPGAKQYKGKHYQRIPGTAAVAVPGTSKHERGHAVDLRIDGMSANSHRGWKTWIAANASKYGLRHGASFGEWWHIETPGQVSESGGTATDSGTPTPRAVADTGSGGGLGELASHNFGERGQSAASRISSFSGKAPGFEHGFSTGGSPTSALAPGDGGSAPIGGSEGMIGVLRNAGFSGEGLRIAYAVMMGESQGNPNAHNPNAGTGDNSYGLFQINMLGKMGPERRKQYGLSRNEDLFNPQKNAEVAFKMSGGGKNWQPWSAYKNGSYRQYYRDDIGDPTAGATPSSGRGGTSVSVGQIVVQSSGQVTSAEAARLARMVVDQINEQAQMKTLGAA